MALSDEHQAKLVEIAGNKEIMEALQGLTDELKFQATQDIVPPLPLDVYGALLGAGTWLDSFMDNIRVTGTAAALEQEQEEEPPSDAGTRAAYQ